MSVARRVLYTDLPNTQDMRHIHTRLMFYDRTEKVLLFLLAMILAYLDPSGYTPIPITAHYYNLRVYTSHAHFDVGWILSYCTPFIPIYILFLIFAHLDTNQHICRHMRMPAYVSACAKMGRLCVSLHTVLCHAVKCRNISSVYLDISLCHV